MHKQTYDYLWIAKRLEFLIEKELVYVSTPVLKIKYCDQEYVNELSIEAIETFETLTSGLIMNFIKKLPTLPKDFESFTLYACDALQHLLTNKMKLYQDECISHFKIEYEKNMRN